MLSSGYAAEVAQDSNGIDTAALRICLLTGYYWILGMLAGPSDWQTMLRDHWVKRIHPHLIWRIITEDVHENTDQSSRTI